MFLVPPSFIPGFDPLRVLISKAPSSESASSEGKSPTRGISTRMSQEGFPNIRLLIGADSVLGAALRIFQALKYGVFHRFSF